MLLKLQSWNWNTATVHRVCKFQCRKRDLNFWEPICRSSLLMVSPYQVMKWLPRSPALWVLINNNTTTPFFNYIANKNSIIEWMRCPAQKISIDLMRRSVIFLLKQNVWIKRGSTQHMLGHPQPAEVGGSSRRAHERQRSDDGEVRSESVVLFSLPRAI